MRERSLLDRFALKRHTVPRKDRREAFFDVSLLTGIGNGGISFTPTATLQVKCDGASECFDLVTPSGYHAIAANPYDGLVIGAKTLQFAQIHSESTADITLSS